MIHQHSRTWIIAGLFHPPETSGDGGSGWLRAEKGEPGENGAQGMKGVNGESFFPDYGPENDRGPWVDEGSKGCKGEPASES